MFVQIGVVLLFVWTVIVTFILFKTRRHYFNLTKRTKENRIDGVLDRFIEQSQDAKRKIEKIEKAVQELEVQARKHFQKIGVVRFNPFGRTNSTDQSFVMALLDKDNSGMVINFIYTHDGVRVYTKKVKDGRGQEYKLSEEEKKAVEAGA